MQGQQQLTAQRTPFWKRGIETISVLLEGKKAGHKQQTIGALDGVRAIACMMVVIFHTALTTYRSVPLWAPLKTFPLFSALALAGDTGVNLFFILSGFLLFLPYASSILYQKPLPGWRRFYLRRIFRILPVYYVSFIIMVFVYAPQFLQLDRWPDWLAFLTLFMDSSATTYKEVNGPFWTLAVEWQFYLLLPLIALGIAVIVNMISRRSSDARTRLKVIVGCLLALAAWGVFSRWLGTSLHAHPIPTTSRLYWPSTLFMFFGFGASVSGLHGKFMENFAQGMLISTLYTYATTSAGQKNVEASTGSVSALADRLKRLSPYLFSAGLLWLLLWFLWKYAMSNAKAIPAIGPKVIPHIYFDIPAELGYGIGYGALVLAILFGGPRLKSFFEWQPLRWLGLLSYGLYMWHLPLFQVCTEFAIAHPTWPPLLLYSFYWVWFIVVTLPGVFLLYLAIERPFIQIGARLTRSRPKQVASPAEEPLTKTQEAPQESAKSEAGI
ncbi:acyltransferase family protein [Ktedonospora formicarum]|uniref:Acyltransferase 3 domain-containing protein n=1 Tax=Ktedonospora formicarum TaxID=2778364 RepID=A0A8J3HU99_9CHLR|nr:acyltransferase [Ktedonospora formicarum]GHO44117.1 hypothetical protein KSX_22800 [Ktedonospora formicarum]